MSILNYSLWTRNKGDGTGTAHIGHCVTSYIGHGRHRLFLNLKFKFVLLCANLFFTMRSRNYFIDSLAQRAVVPSPEKALFYLMMESRKTPKN